MITAQMVKELREKTGAGMMKCKEALNECNGNLEEAIDFLRKKGLASADKRSGRATSQGLVVPLISENRRTAGIVEANCETDFVAKTDDFINFANKLAELVLNTPSVKSTSDLEKLSIDGQTIDDYRKSMIAKTGENITIGRAEHLEIPSGGNGFFDNYVHGNGAIGVIVEVKTADSAVATNTEAIQAVHNIALQAAAMKPLYTFSNDVPVEVMNREKDVIIGQIKNDPKNANKPEEIVNKIVEGRLAKYCEENCLFNQVFFLDDTKKISDLLADLSKKIGSEVTLVSFRRWARGEGCETPEEATAEAGA